MACATLKRNLDSTMSMAQLPSKRRRCAPFAASSSTSPGIKMSQTGSSVFGETVSASAKYTPERMAQEICDEIMRLRRRRQLRLATGAAASCSSSSGSEGDCSPPRAHTKKVHQRALFTFKQVRAICERMLREQEAALRAEYNSVLHTKLDEQYASFVRFNIDQPPRYVKYTKEADTYINDTDFSVQRDCIREYRNSQLFRRYNAGPRPTPACHLEWMLNTTCIKILFPAICPNNKG